MIVQVFIGEAKFFVLSADLYTTCFCQFPLGSWMWKIEQLFVLRALFNIIQFVMIS